MSGDVTAQHIEVAIIGSGFAGLCMGIALRNAGIEEFVILEKDAQFGGTWRVNTYPGAACDVPSHLYSFSFAQNADWSRKFPRQQELLAYTEQLVRDFALLPHIHLGSALVSAQYENGRWLVRTTRATYSARLLVLATGALSRPSIPHLPGIENFQGKVFHSAQWDHELDLRGKRVAVIGTGASAVQFIPEIAPKVAQLDIYQRTAHWMIPRPDRAITSVEKWLLRRVKALQWLYRGIHYARYEVGFLGFARAPILLKALRLLALRHIRKQIPHDAELRKKVTPHYTMGCKRILIMSDYYPTLTRANVALITDGVEEIRAHGVLGKDGRERPTDVIIYGTGFDVEHGFDKVPIRGRDGALLSEAARGGLEAYKGAAIPGFPNLFMITGPNTGLGHNSMIYMIESGVHYVMEAIKHMRAHRVQSVEVKADIARSYNDTLQRRLHATVWNSGCHSWYLSSSGKNHTLWPGFTFEYRRLTRRFDAASYRIEP